MPLITKHFSALERVREQADARSLNAGDEDQYVDTYDDFEEGEEDERADGSLLAPPQGQKSRTIPALPPRSELRASRLEKLAVELSSLEQAARKEESACQPAQDPHESYLSSEEEASESADDYDESIIELESDRLLPSRASSRQSHEDIARVVSFIFAGKPQLVDVFAHEQPASPQRESRPRRRPSPLRLRSDSTRPSTSSTRSSSLGASTTSLHTRQHSSAQTSLSSLASNPKPQFLEIDPFAAPCAQIIEVTTPVEPSLKTPTSMANAAWKSGMKGVSRTFSFARAKRRPSMPKLNLASTQGVVGPCDPATAPATGVPEVSSPIQDQISVRYEDNMRNVVKAPPILSPKLKTKASSNLLGLGRRRSVRGGI